MIAVFRAKSGFDADKQHCDKRRKTESVYTAD